MIEFSNIVSATIGLTSGIMGFAFLLLFVRKITEGRKFIEKIIYLSAIIFGILIAIYLLT